MDTVARAFAWQFWARNRFVSGPALAYLAALVVVINVLPAGTLDPNVVGPLALPLIGMIAWLIGTFSYGDDADILARESGYPRRAFTLPLRTAALVGWPMALGATAVAVLWLVISGLVFRSGGLSVPIVWPALLAAGLLAMTQALIWLPFPLTILRILVIIPVLSALVAGALLGAAYQVSPVVLAAASASLVPLAYALAVFGVARARRGDIAMRSWPLLERSTSASVTERPPFASSAAALSWLEWRGNLFLLPMFALLTLLPLWLLVYFLSELGATAMLTPGLLAYPLVMAAIAGGSLGNCHSWRRNDPAIPVFLAARPVTSGALLAVKFRGAIFTTLVTCGLIALGLALLLPLSPAGLAVLRWIERLVESQGTPRGIAWLVLLAVGLPWLTWKTTVEQFWIGLAGRYWIIVLACIAIPTLISGLGLAAAFGHSYPDFADAMLAAAPWLTGAALVLKLALGALVAWSLVRRGWMGPRTATWCAAAWVSAAAGLIALALWIVPPEIGSPIVIGISAVVLGLPLVRLGLAPLALEWNRHR
jgi:hypothetical protein